MQLLDGFFCLVGFGLGLCFVSRLSVPTLIRTTPQILQLTASYCYTTTAGVCFTLIGTVGTTVKAPAYPASPFDTCRWNLHHSCAFVATADKDAVRGWDLRTPTENCYTISRPHGARVHQLDFNPNKQYDLLTTGEDGESTLLAAIAF